MDTLVGNDTSTASTRRDEEVSLEGAFAIVLTKVGSETICADEIVWTNNLISRLFDVGASVASDSDWFPSDNRFGGQERQSEGSN